MFFLKRQDEGKQKLQTTTVITAEYKLKNNDELFRRKNIAGVRRMSKLIVFFIYSPNNSTFERINIPLDQVDYIHFFFTEKPLYKKGVNND